MSPSSAGTHVQVVDPLGDGLLRASQQRDHQPRRLGGLRDARRRGPVGVVAARDRHRGLQVLPQGGHPRRSEARRAQRARARPPRRAHDPRGGRASSAATSRDRRTPTRSRPSSRTCSSTRRRAFNSPVWFNCGLYQRYGITGSGGNYAWTTRGRSGRRDDRTRTSSPQCSACFIQAVDDDLMSIYELVKNEARLFKYGSGTGTNFSQAARPAGEALGRRHVARPHELPRGVRSRGGRDQVGRHDAARGEDGLPRHGPPGDRRLHRSGRCARRRRPRRSSPRATTSDFNGEAYHTGRGPELEQLGARHRRVHAARWRTTASGSTYCRTTAAGLRHVHGARPVDDDRREPRGRCADPGVQYDTTINDWHTCPNTGRINASNPCCEYMFLDDTACNLASINLTKFLREDGSFDVEGYRHAIRDLHPGAGDPRRLLALPDARRSRRTATTTGRSGSATRTSARC